MKPKRSTARAHPARALVAVLLMLVHVAAPALALASTACGGDGCGEEANASSCCCSAPVAEVERSCCSAAPEVATLVAGPRTTRACTCDEGSLPLPQPTPARGEVGEGGSLAHWIRVHAERSSDTPLLTACGPVPAVSPGPRGRTGRAGDLAVLRPAELGARARPAPGPCARRLLERGAPGLLAVLSVSRR